MYFVFPLPVIGGQSIVTDSQSLYTKVQRTDHLQCHIRAPEPDRHTNATPINIVKWEPPPIREPRLFLTLYPLLFI